MLDPCFNYLLIRWKRVNVGPALAVVDSSAPLEARDSEAAERAQRRRAELTATDLSLSDNFAAQYIPDATFPLPMAPTGIEYRDAPANSITFTLDGAVLQKAPMRRVDIALSAESGYRFKFGFDRNGIPMYARGQDLHRELHGFLSDYLRAADDSRLTFHDFYSGRQLWVEPTDIGTAYDAEHRIAPRWSIGMVGYEQTGYPSSGLGAVFSILPQIRDASRQVQRWADLGAAAAAAASLTVETLTAAFGELASVLLCIPRAIEATAVLIEAPRKLADYPLTFWRQITTDIATAIGRVNQAIASYDYSGDRVEDLTAMRTTLRTFQRSMEIMSYASATAGGVPSQTYVIRAGDSLKSIALSTLGDAGRWYEIAAINGLVPPYLSTAGLPGTATPGMRIDLPPDASFTDSADAGAAAGDLYGVDYALSDTGDWLKEPGALPADVQLVRGVPCAAQGLRILFGTRQGENRRNPGFGIVRGIGDPSYSSAGMLLANLTDQILRDGRFVRVLAPKVTETGVQLDVSLVAVLRSGTRFPVGAVLGA